MRSHLRNAALQHLQVQAHGRAAHGGAARAGARARDALQHQLRRVVARVAPHGLHVCRRQLPRRLQALPQRLPRTQASVRQRGEGISGLDLYLYFRLS